MSTLRFRLLAAVVWTFVLTLASCESLLPVSGVAQQLSLLAMICLIAVPWLPPPPLHWSMPIATALVIAGRAAAGYPLLADGLAASLVDVLSLTISIALASQVAASLNEFYKAISRVMLQGVAVRPRRLQQVQSRLYREIRRARFTKQPLTLLAVAADPLHCEAAEERLTAEAMQRLAREHLQGRLAELLREEARNCGTIACFDHHLVTVLPATTAVEAQSTLESLRAKARQALNVELKIGLASFPKEEVTLVGLLQRAENQIRRQRAERPEQETLPNSDYLFVSPVGTSNKHPAPQT